MVNQQLQDFIYDNITHVVDFKCSEITIIKEVIHEESFLYNTDAIRFEKIEESNVNHLNELINLTKERNGFSFDLHKDIDEKTAVDKDFIKYFNNYFSKFESPRHLRTTFLKIFQDYFEDVVYDKIEPIDENKKKIYEIEQRVAKFLCEYAIKRKLKGIIYDW